MVDSCASLTYFSHLGLAVASWTLRLYRRSNWNCSFADSFEKSGGHTFFSLTGLLYGLWTCVFLIADRIVGIGLSAIRRVRVGNMLGWVGRVCWRT